MATKQFLFCVLIVCIMGWFKNFCFNYWAKA